MEIGGSAIEMQRTSVLRVPGRASVLGAQSSCAVLGSPTGLGARALAPCGDQPLKLLRGHFGNSETRVEILESVRDKQVFIVADLKPPINDGIMEVALLAQALKLSDARRVSALIPCFPYARQDRRADGRNPISARLICDFLALSGVHQVVTVDVHATQIEGFFPGPFENVNGLPHLIPTVCAREGSDVVVVSPDEGGSKRATKFARLYERLSAGFVQSIIMSKVRLGPGLDPEVSFSGGRDLVRGQSCIIVDDMIDSGGSAVASARELKNAGAARVVVCATHAVLSGTARERLEGSGVVDAVYLTDTIEVSLPPGEFWRVVSLAPLVREVIRRLSHEGGSLSELRDRIDLGELLPSAQKSAAP